jgi:IMP dehydrogenase
MKIYQSRNLNDIGLIPRELSYIKSRSDIDLSQRICNTNLRLPIIASPMDTVCNSTMAIEMQKLGGVGIIHRFQTIDNQCEELKIALDKTGYISSAFYFHSPESVNIGVAVGINNDSEERLHALIETFNNNKHTFSTTLWICFDTANGFNINTGEFIKHFLCSKLYDSNRHIIIAGNVSSEEGFNYLREIGVNIIRVGIGTGSVCTTSLATGVSFGAVDMLAEIVPHKIENECYIMLDGGLKTSGDIAKALALGADLVMLGGMLAGFDESPNKYILGDMVYRGMASYDATQELKNIHGETTYKNPEGKSITIEPNGKLAPFLKDIDYGIRSSLSYMGCKNIKEFHDYFIAYPDAIVGINH